MKRDALNLVDEMVATIMASVEDPAAWLVTVRRLVEAAGLRPERCIALPGTLWTVVFGVVDEADKQGRVAKLGEEVRRLKR